MLKLARSALAAVRYELELLGGVWAILYRELRLFAVAVLLLALWLLCLAVCIVWDSAVIAVAVALEVAWLILVCGTVIGFVLIVAFKPEALVLPLRLLRHMQGKEAMETFWSELERARESW